MCYSITYSLVTTIYCIHTTKPVPSLECTWKRADKAPLKWILRQSEVLGEATPGAVERCTSCAGRLADAGSLLRDGKGPIWDGMRTSLLTDPCQCQSLDNPTANYVTFLQGCLPRWALPRLWFYTRRWSPSPQWEPPPQQDEPPDFTILETSLFWFIQVILSTIQSNYSKKSQINPVLYNK